MEKELLTISLRIGNATTIEFYAIKQQGQTEDNISYLRMEENGELMCTHGAMYVNLKTRKISMSYDIFNIVADILSIKKSGDNVMYTIATDMFKADLYAVNRQDFAEMGEDMFI